MRSVLVAGVGMTKFATPKAARNYVEMGVDAVCQAFGDAELTYDDAESAYASYLYGDTCSGQRVLYDVGVTGIPVYNVNGACASGSLGLSLARQAVASGAAECVLAVGFEQMTRGVPPTFSSDRPSPWDKMLELAHSKYGESEAPMAAQLFGAAAREYMERYDCSAELFGLVTVKARKHAALNPNAVFRDVLSLDEVMSSPSVFDPITRFQICPPTCGAAAAVLCSEEFAALKGIAASVEIAGQGVTTDSGSTFGGSMISMVGYDMAVNAAQQAYEQASIGPDDVDVVELHDCFASNEIMSYEALGLTEEGSSERFVADGDNTFGGKFVVNPSGGLISKGHPIGATGLAQCAELVWQLRDRAGKRQVPNARVALQHNLGLGGACAVTVYKSNR